ncbi:hypothetical protein BJP36_34310 [Moorena producens JHB]|uniref:Uncharacterized protein n=1 Tax=Moorena producens (strain JHB) TaxID=1454205 RepID=A0A1D9G9D9_MOOP1|nr:hypothetical protein [Moorena producens]AOY84248.1 hypothetical protein BJP36_34310 [Moorena producens JHB]
MKIADLENLQEITIEKLSSVEGGMIAIIKPIDDGELPIAPTDHKRLIYPYCPPPPPLPCYTRPIYLPDKGENPIAIISCPVIL